MNLCRTKKIKYYFQKYLLVGKFHAVFFFGGGSVLFLIFVFLALSFEWEGLGLPVRANLQSWHAGAVGEGIALCETSVSGRLFLGHVEERWVVAVTSQARYC